MKNDKKRDQRRKRLSKTVMESRQVVEYMVEGEQGWGAARGRSSSERKGEALIEIGFISWYLDESYFNRIVCGVHTLWICNIRNTF